MTWSIRPIIRSLGTCPWRTLARSAIGPARRRPLTATLDGLVAPWAPDAREALARVSPEPPVGGATWLPLHGPVPWSTSPTAFVADDILTGWMRCRLTDAFHAARVSLLNGDDDAAGRAVAMVGAFHARNPVGSRPAWTSAMEAGLRAIRLIHVAALLAQAGASRAAVGLEPVACALADHEAFLRSRTDWRLHFTGNHHLVALAGTFVLMAHLPATPARRRDARRAWRLFWRELRREIGSDGLHFESSTGYHLLAAETAAHVALAGARLGFERTGRADACLAACARATSALMRPDGTLAPIGDCDDGAFLDLSPGREAPMPLDARPAAALLALVTGDRACAARSLDDRRALEAIAWMAGRAGLDRLAELRGGGLPRAACMPQGGMAVLAADSAPLAHVTVSATPAGRAGTGGHGHDDAGSYDFWLGGPLVADRGTGAYARDPGLRRRLRSVLGHAVVAVDGRDQNPPGRGIFRRRARSNPLMTGFSEEGGGVVVIGHHGYCVSPGSVTVLRQIALSGAGALDALDEVEGAGEHDVVLRLPWAPGITLATGSPDALRFDIVRGAARVATCEIEATSPGGVPPASVRHVPAEHAPRQLEIVTSTTTEVAWRCRLPMTIRHRIVPKGPAPG